VKNSEGLSAGKKILFALWLAGSLALIVSLHAQQTPPRILSDIDESARTTLLGTHPPMARPENESGRVPAGTKLEGVALEFSRTPEQQAALDALIAAQLDPSSPSYHQWLTSDEFGARFGAADADLSRVQSWLMQHGFIVDGISRSRNRITFSGTVAQIESAFGTELHYYTAGGETHFAPSQDLSVPAALAPVVQAVTNLSSFRPRPHIRNAGPRVAVNPDFTSAQSGSHYLTPGDVATIYDIAPAYQGGYNGAGQTIAVLGQSAIVLSDIEHFQTAAGFSIKDPTITLVPSTGASTTTSGDEAESDLDLEYASTIASGAAINFVYAGSPNTGVFVALQYAVDQKIGQVISMSYGTCEMSLGSNYAGLNGVLQQAASQGQTVVVSAGDNGSTDCYGDTTLSTTQQQTLAVDFPASSQYVTAMGGTEFPAADVAPTNTTYWKPAGGTDVISSALSYIPEQVWNNDAVANGVATLSSSGGGASALTSRPSWQTGVPGIPSGSFRLVPDISLDASNVNAPYLYCSSDTSTGVTGSCTNGFRDSSKKYLTAAGGTSFDAPIFAGMVAILNDRLNNTTGQGVINSTLYTLAANASTYAKAFHDLTSGNNECNLGTAYCSTAGASEYPSGAGYDEASGLGSIDFYNLVLVWPGVTNPPSFQLSATNVTVAQGNSGASTVTVTPQNGFTGTISWTVTSSPLLTNGCFSLPNLTVSSSTAVSATLTVHTNSASCPAPAIAPASGRNAISSLFRPAGSGNASSPFVPSSGAVVSMTAGMAFAGLTFILLFGKSSRRMGTLAAIGALTVLGLGLAGCAGTSGASNSTTPTVSNVAKGTYTVTIVGTDTTTASITATTTLTVTVD
jgi:subtilase family serine protease